YLTYMSRLSTSSLLLTLPYSFSCASLPVFLCNITLLYLQQLNECFFSPSSCLSTVPYFSYSSLIISFFLPLPVSLSLFPSLHPSLSPSLFLPTSLSLS